MWYFYNTMAGCNSRVSGQPKGYGIIHVKTDSNDHIEAIEMCDFNNIMKLLI